MLTVNSRVDLRPVADHTEGSEAGDHQYNNVTEHFLNVMNDVPSEPGATSRRRSTGLSLYIHHTLNFRRMREATPEERIDALRQIRLVNRASNGDPERGERARTRVGSRLSRLWGPQQAGSSEAVAPGPEVSGPEEDSQISHALPGRSNGH